MAIVPSARTVGVPALMNTGVATHSPGHAGPLPVQERRSPCGSGTRRPSPNPTQDAKYVRLFGDLP